MGLFRDPSTEGYTVNLIAIPLTKMAFPYIVTLSKKFWRDGRVVEGARLELVYTVTPYRGFESLFLRQI